MPFDSITKPQRAAFAPRTGSENPYVLLPLPANDLTDALPGDTEGGGQAHNRFAPLVAPPDLLIAVMVSWRVVGEGHRRRFLTKIHEQHPIVDRVHQMLECPVFKAPQPYSLLKTSISETRRAALAFGKASEPKP
jgi:hypothetical protein